MKPHELTELTTNALVQRWRSTFAVATTHEKCGHLRRFLRHLSTVAGTRALDRTLPHVPVAQARTRCATPDEISNLTTKAAPWVRLFILLCYHLGLRRSEALSAAPAGWNREQHTLAVIRKGNKRRTVPVSTELEQLFDAAGCPPGEELTPLVWLLKGPRDNGSYDYTVQTMYGAWRLLCRRCGIAGLNPHDLRRTYINVAYISSGFDLRAAQALAGHDTMTSTIWYLTPFNPENLKPLHRLMTEHLKGKIQ